MPDYRCPSCRGGFPAAAADDDVCPWCGETMDGSDDDSGSVVTPTARPIEPGGQRIRDDLKPGRDLEEMLEESDDYTPEFRRRPPVPFWDSGVRCNDPELYDHGLGASSRLGNVGESL